MRPFRHTLVNEFLEHSAALYPDKTALVHAGNRYTYAWLDAASNKLAAALLAEGVRRGDRVAIFMDNCMEAVVSIFAALKAGAAFMVINHTTKAEKLQYLLNNSRAKVLLAQAAGAGAASGAACPYLARTIISHPRGGGPSAPTFEEIMDAGGGGPVDSGCIDLDLASIIYTSGSTGQPKGVMLSHLNMISAAHSITTYLENRETDVIMNVLPISFDYGLYQVLMGFMAGAEVVLEKSFAFPFQIVEGIRKERVTGLPGVPTFFSLLLGLEEIDRYDFSSIRYITNTAAALPLSHIRRLRELFPHASIYSMYGLTECKRVSFLPPGQIDARPASVGRGMPNEEVYIVNEKGERAAPGETGELVVRGSNVMMGYWEMPGETARRLRPGKYPGERVLHTGDLFRMDEEGYLYFVARKDDIIKCRGEKVSPREIENVLYSLEGVQEAAAVGVPDEICGQVVKVYVALGKGCALTANDILGHCSRHLENFMVPKKVEIRQSLPKTATGKIDKNGLH
ncbi:MAG: AMP-binding protein [Nitrospiraceae bacterium]|nr:AMP-binding protein [Nitrospiraceae bacterium]